jgi:hypothetical protein
LHLLLLAHIQPFYVLDQVRVEPKPEVQVEQAQVEATTNLVWIKASPGAFNQYSMSFILNLVLCYGWLCIKLIGVV